MTDQTRKTVLVRAISIDLSLTPSLRCRPLLTPVLLRRIRARFFFYIATSSDSHRLHRGFDNEQGNDEVGKAVAADAADTLSTELAGMGLSRNSTEQLLLLLDD